MDADPRLIEINEQIEHLRAQIEEQKQKLAELNLWQRLLENRKLKELQHEYEKKTIFRETLRANIERNRIKKRSRKRRVEKAIS